MTESEPQKVYSFRHFRNVTSLCYSQKKRGGNDFTNSLLRNFD